MSESDEDVEMEDGDEEEEVQSFWELADACIQAMDFDAAEKVFREALKVQANDPDIMDALGDVLVQKGDIDQALKVFHAPLSHSRFATPNFSLNINYIS
jgi:Tfp pilus assembly protein PilF